jgi:hypothetical protein
MKKSTHRNNINCWNTVKKINFDETIKPIFKTLYEIEKLYSRKLMKENIRIEVIEIIFIKNKIYGFTLPNVCKNFKKVRHNNVNQDEPIKFEEQKPEFRFFGEKQFNSNLYIGFWQDPDKYKRYYGSFTFIYPTTGTKLRGMWLGEDKKSDKDINSGSWILSKKFNNYEEYIKKKDEICQ